MVMLLETKLNEDGLEESIEKLPVKPKLPEDFRLIYNCRNNKIFKKHYEYLRVRGFTEKKMKQFRIGVSKTYPFINRVIFPSFDLDLNLNYFISRSINPSEYIRYRNFNGKRKELIFRHCDIDFIRMQKKKRLK